ncbi:hypothetical protein ACLB2K_051829 [Fragaria x ananassa]
MPELVEKLIAIALSDHRPGRVVKIRAELDDETRKDIIKCLKRNIDVFAWSNDMSGIRPKVITHKLSFDQRVKPVKQHQRPSDAKRYAATKEEVDRLLENGSIREVDYLQWVSNVVMIQNPNGKWRICVDYTNLNKAFSKDSFFPPCIDQLVDSTAGHKLLSFMDAYASEEHPHRNHAETLEKAFKILKGYGMKLNPDKCVFGVQSGKFLGFMVSERGIEANPKKIQALLDMKSPTTGKEIQSLTGRVAALNRFISRSTDRYVPFFKALKKMGKDIDWTDLCERAFISLKEHMGKAPVLNFQAKTRRDALNLPFSINNGN